MSIQLNGLLSIDKALAARGVFRMSPWWREQLTEFYSGEYREHVVCAGRGSVKSGAIAKTSIVETLFPVDPVPIGERHYFAIVSENVSEASKTAGIVERYLQLLGVEAKRTGDTIELAHEPRGIRVLACRIGAVSGFRCYGWAADECAKWRDADSGANPAAEVISSIRAMTVTHPRARGRMFSSPLGRIGTFHEAFARGTTPSTLVSHAPTWIANPSVTEAQTRELEPDERVWRREYRAEPQSAALAAFDADAIDRAFAPKPPLPPRRRAIVIDASSGKKDGWTWAVAGWNRDDNGDGYVSVDAVDGIEGSFWSTVSAEEIVDGIAHLASELGIDVIHADQRESYTLRALFEARGLTFVVHDWTSASKARAIEILRRWFADGQIALPEHTKLRAELLAYEETITSSGTLRYGAPNNRHDDYASLLVTLAHAELSGDLIFPIYEIDPKYDRYLPRLRV